MRVRPPILRPVLAALGAMVVFTSAAAAQVRVDFVPYSGVYLPTASVVDQGISLRQKPAFTLGNRVTLWLPGRVAIEGTFGYSPSGVIARDAFSTLDTSAYVITASARVLVRLSPADAATSLHVGGGVGLVGHRGDAYAGGPNSGVGGTSRVGGIVLVGGTFKLGPSPLALRLDVEDYVFRAHFDNLSACLSEFGVCELMSGAPAATRAKLQNDLVVSFGVAVPLARR